MTEVYLDETAASTATLSKWQKIYKRYGFPGLEDEKTFGEPYTTKTIITCDVYCETPQKKIGGGRLKTCIIDEQDNIWIVGCGFMIQTKNGEESWHSFGQRHKLSFGIDGEISKALILVEQVKQESTPLDDTEENLALAQ